MYEHSNTAICSVGGCMHRWPACLRVLLSDSKLANCRLAHWLLSRKLLPIGSGCQNVKTLPLAWKSRLHLCCMLAREKKKKHRSRLPFQHVHDSIHYKKNQLPCLRYAPILESYLGKGCVKYACKYSIINTHLMLFKTWKIWEIISIDSLKYLYFNASKSNLLKG